MLGSPSPASVAPMSERMPLRDDAPAIGSAAAPPKTMRELLGRAYMLRGTVAWRHPASTILELQPRDDASGIDICEIPEFAAVSTGASVTTIGAFASLSAFAAVVADETHASESLAMVRLRLSISGARLTVVRDGVLASIALDAYRPSSAMLPVSIDIPALANGIGLAERRRSTSDGAASYELGVVTALRISQLHHFVDVRIMVALDGVVHRATEAEALLEGKRFGISALSDAARASATAISSIDARTSAAARAVAPLVLSALREAVAIAKPKEDQPRRRFFGQGRKKKR